MISEFWDNKSEMYEASKMAVCVISPFLKCVFQRFWLGAIFKRIIIPSGYIYVFRVS